MQSAMVFKRPPSWLRLLGPLTLAALVIYLRVDLRATLSLLAGADRVLVGAAVLGVLPLLLLKSWRWQVILARLQVRISFGRAVRLYALGFGAGAVTPGQLGDAVKVAYFSGTDFGRAVVATVLDRLWDLLVVLSLAGIGAAFFARALQSARLAFVSAAGALFVAAVAAFHPRLQRRLLRLLMGGAAQDVDCVADRQATGGRQLARQLLLSVAAAAVVYARLYLLVEAVGIDLAPLPFVAAMSLASIAALLPVSLAGGAGTRDAALLAMAPALGITGAQALAVATLMLLLQAVNGATGLAVWAFERRRRTQKA